MKLNLDFYKKKEENISEEEKDLINRYIQKINHEEYESQFSETITDKEIYYLSSCSQNILNWYSFKKEDNILEIGGDLGQITHTFIKQCKEVTTVEPNLIKAKAIAKRYENIPNIEVIAGNFLNIKLEKKFNYIVLIGSIARVEEIMGQDMKLAEMIKKLEKYLEENGKFLIAVDNKFGLRYFAGNPDNILNKKFQSIIGYHNEPKKIETFTKSRLERKLQEIGYQTNFYYPLPDYKMPNVIFTEAQLPKYNNVDKYNPYYTENSTIIINEIDAFREILKNDEGMFTFFANSFLVEASKKKEPIQYKYISFNNMRKETYRLITKISNQYVEKQEVNECSKKHYDQIKQNIRQLEKEGIKTLDYEEDGKIRSKYIEQEFLLNNVITRALEKKQYDVVEDVMNKYINILQNNTYHEQFYDNTIFAKYKIEIQNKDLIKELHFQKNGLWDMTFKNCFYIDGELYFFDQEWREENLPAEYILYRSILYTISLRRFINIEDWIEKYGLIKYRALFEQLDNKLQEKIRDDKIWKFYSQDKWADIDATKQELKNLQLRNQAQKKAMENLQKERDGIIQEYQVYKSIQERKFTNQLKHKIKRLREEKMNKKINIYKNQKKKLKIKNPKKVSVIIPNYNYANYIIERIDSILMQTYPIYEIIILDDCSPDNSVDVINKKIEQIKKEYPTLKVKFIVNEKNSGGCVFKQWKKGFDIATGDFIWIAEADDSAENNFVEELIKPFDDPEMILSYCESARIDGENNLITKGSFDLYDMCRTGEWEKSYIWTGKEENIYHLSVTNTILNVSSVIWRKKDYTEIFEKAGEFKVAGDWYIYYNILKNGKISWNAKPLNYYRKHGSSVSTDVKAEIEFNEICRIQNEISAIYELPEEIKDKQKIRRSLMEPYLPKKEEDNGKKKIAWVMPHPGKGSGGHRTIIQNVNALLKAGYECDIYVEEDGVSTPQSVKNKINNWYEKCDAGIFVGFDVKKSYDLMFATGWQTIDFVRKLPAKKKAYFIQDFEPWFFPMGDQYIITENSYRYGFLPVTIGKWLSYKMQSEFNTPSEYFDFGADLNVYKPLENIQKENAICFVYQPEKPRRCDYIGLKALKLVKALRPDVKIYLYGSSAEATFEFECENLHIIPIEKCNELYNKCKVGICMSASNPSRIPFEMMAAGLPVVELYKENNIYDLPDGGVLLAEPTPEAIASAIVHLIDYPEECEKMSTFGKNYMKNYPLEKGFEQFIKAVNDMLETEYQDLPKINKIYQREPFKASEEAKNISFEQVKQEAIPIDNHGPIYRFLRKCKKLLKKCLNKIGIKK